MGADCNGCGACCDPFVTIIAPIHLQDGTAERVIERPEADWMRRHLTPMRRADGLDRCGDWMQAGGWSDVPAVRNLVGQVARMQVALIPSHFYQCDIFDPVTRRCTDYSNRPEVCRGYPWYGSAPDANKALPLMCSYRADAGLPVADIPVEWRQL
jgi:Fe-S-cluster containining protein